MVNQFKVGVAVGVLTVLQAGFAMGAWASKDLKCTYENYIKIADGPNQLIRCPGYEGTLTLRRDQKVKAIEFEVTLSSGEQKKITISNPQEPLGAYGHPTVQSSGVEAALRQAGINPRLVKSVSHSSLVVDSEIPMYRDGRLVSGNDLEALEKDRVAKREADCHFVSGPQLIVSKMSPVQGCSANCSRTPQLCTGEVSCWGGQFQARAVCLSLNQGQSRECPSAYKCSTDSSMALEDPDSGATPIRSKNPAKGTSSGSTAGAARSGAAK